MSYENTKYTISDLLDEDSLPNEDLKDVADFCGFEVAKSLIANMQGLTINVPSNPYKKVIEKHIIKNYDGTRKTLVKLVRECNVTEKYIYNLWKRVNS